MQGDALVAMAVFIAGAMIGATAVVGVCGVLLARRLAMGGLWVVALVFVSIALFGAIALLWLAPGWADALAALGALCAVPRLGMIAVIRLIAQRRLHGGILWGRWE
jgi:hypothetical protein